MGSNLYEIDTEAVATVQADEPSVTKTTTPVAEPAVASPPAPSKTPKVSPPVAAKSTDHSRSPSIHFLGKDGWKKKLAGVPKLPLVPKNFGRPIFSEEEIEALMSGGANLRLL